MHSPSTAQGPFVAAFASANLGDVSPNLKGPKCEGVGEDCDADSTCNGDAKLCWVSPLGTWDGGAIILGGH